MASSIHIEAVKTSSFLHNDRTMKVSYLIDDSSKNYCSVDSKTALENFNHCKEIATKKYQELTKQKLQSKTIFLKEAIINLEAHHTEKDLEPIIKKLESYGFKVLQVSIHRDEGFLNKETNKNQYNYHAHITMFNLDLQTGKSVKFGKNYRTELSKLQTFVAKELNMERGKVSDKVHALEIGKEYDPHQTRRLGTHELKRAKKELEEQRLSIKQELTYKHKEYQAKITSLENVANPLKKELHALNNEISKLKNNSEAQLQKIAELNQKIENLEKINTSLVHNQTETAQKLQENEKMIEALNADLYDVDELLIPLLSSQEMQNVTTYPSFFLRLREKFTEMWNYITHIEAENKALREENIELRGEKTTSSSSSISRKKTNHHQ